MATAALRLIRVTRRYDQVIALQDFDLEVKPGEFMVLVGPSGSGKSTVLRLVAGLDDPTEGTIEIAGRDLRRVPPRDRNVAMVFQDYALYPHMTCFENIAYGLKVRHIPKAAIRERVTTVARLLGVEDELPRRPGTLSGGQRQRVAIGRALVRDPAVFLMDEPLSNLDARLRVYMRTEIRALQERLSVTTLYVTHDQTEAMTMGDRVAVMRGGQLQQLGTPQELYDSPVNIFVAGFIGSPAMNFLTGCVEGDALRLGHRTFPLSEAIRIDGRREVIVGIRPEDIEVAADAPGASSLQGEVWAIEPLGSETIVHLRISGVPPDLPELQEVASATGVNSDSGLGPLVVRIHGRPRVRARERLPLTVAPDRLHLFDLDTHLAIPRESPSAVITAPYLPC